MKKFTLLVLSIGLWIGCTTNEDSLNSEKEKNLSLTIKGLSTQSLISNPYDILEYVKNPKDKDDENVNKQLLTLTEKFRDLFIDNKYNTIVFNRAKMNANNTISLIEFVNSVNSPKKSELLLTVQLTNITYPSKNPANKGEIEQYIPAIFIPNIEIADVNKQPIISAGIEVNSELNGMEEYEDFIVAWYFDGSKWIEFLLDEKTAMQTENPIFVFDNAEELMTNMSKQEIKDNPVSSNRAVYRFNSHRYKINYRYESSGRSEFYLTGVNINQIGTHALLSNGTSRRQLAWVRKRWIGDWRWHLAEVASKEPGTNTFWNTYERDWARSSKWLGSPSRYGHSSYLSGRRKYSHEWYAYNPSNVNNSPLYWQNSRYYTNYKGGLLIQK